MSIEYALTVCGRNVPSKFRIYRTHRAAMANFHRICAELELDESVGRYEITPNRARGFSRSKKNWVEVEVTTV